MIEATDTTTRVAPRHELGATLHRHPRTRLALTLTPPLGWLVVFYLGALFLLLINAFWTVDSLTAQIVHDWSLQNFETLLSSPVYRTITLRTVWMASAVTITDIALAVPIGYFAARVASPRLRSALLVAVVMPLWTSYLIKAFAWQTITAPRGLLESMLDTVGLPSPGIGNSLWSIWLTFTYLWLPFVVLPVYAALERVPESYLEASSDLGARGWTTLRKVVWPLALPGIVAGSIFSFSLTLGDYIAPILVGNTKFIGNVIYDSVGVANNLPFAAAFSMVPIAIMAVYLSVARRLGAFEAL
jgi:putative spermidine/putrescine transport system permease protein